MKTNNDIIKGFAISLNDATAAVVSKSVMMGDDENENDAIIKTLNVLIESVRSQTVLLQQAIDAYK